MVTVSSQPTIKQRSISVSIDESLLAKQLDIDKQVQRMAAYDQARGDSYDSTTLPFFVPEIPEVVESDAVPTGGGLSTDFLIDKGVEIVSAIAFLFLLLKGLKSAKGGRPAAAQVAAGQVAGTLLTPLSPDGVPLPPIEIAPEQLARAQVEDMVKNNPERVAQILSNWVIEDRNTVNS
jgi:flagellar biosynthesis/type III secretory pathway M-ring protein FliF/YscJ